MRIEKIKLKNLNSLTGTWEIDLSHPDYHDGLFAITGPTGSGKTTILDAVCLALYGSTPRLDRVTSGDNEIISRQTASCSAEVIFRTASGRYMAQWEQRRAYNKIDGKLQSPGHRLSEYPGGRLLVDSASTTPGRVEEVTGLGFGRFTRSVLLAQGRFAAFLEASAESRSDILEQITGTELYSRISIKSYECWAAARRELETRQTALGSLVPITDEQEAELKAQVNALNEKAAQLESLLSELARALVWRKRLTDLEAQTIKIKERQSQLSARTACFQPEADRLALALRALVLTGPHSVLQSQRTELNRIQAALEKICLQLPDLEGKAAETVQLSAASNLEVEAAKSELEKLGPISVKTRELDLKIKEGQKRCQSELTDLERAGQELSKLKYDLAASQKELTAKTELAEKLKDELEKTIADAALAELLPALNEKAKMAKKNAALVQERRLEAAKARNKAAGLRADCSKVKAKLDQTILAQNEAIDRQARLELELNSITGERPISDVRSELELAAAELSELKGALEIWENLKNTLKSLNTAEKRRHEQDTEALTIKRHLEDLSALSQRLENELSRLTEDLKIKNSILNLTALRGELVDGAPCPLCGSSHHPWTHNLPVEPAVTDRAVKEAEKKVKQAHKEIQAGQIELVKKEKDLEQTDREIAAFNAALPDLVKRLDGTCQKLEVKAGPEGDRGEAITAKWAQKNGQLAGLKEILAKAEATERTLAQDRDQAQKLAANLAALDKQHQAAVFAAEAENLLASRVEAEAATLEAETSEVMKDLAAETSARGAAGDVSTALAALTKRRDAYASKSGALTELGTGLASLSAMVSALSERVLRDDQALTKASLALDELAKQLEALITQRRDLFGDLDPAAEDMRLRQALAKAEAYSVKANKSMADAATTLDRAQLTSASLTRELDQRKQATQSLELGFSQQLKEAGFSGEAEYLKAVLTDETRKALLDQSEKLANEKSALNALELENAKNLADEKARRLTEESAAAIGEGIKSLTAEKTAALTEIGRLTGQLSENERLKESRRAANEAVAEAKKDFGRFDRLYNLIGASDGKRYRNYVQGLTFDTLIALANRQLKRMSDRYILFHDPNRPLQASVVDSYQASEVRPTKNLSGGESFIVSLALALGLSSMAGENVRVDSLFLDEGFGTLDEEALDLALDTLSGLRQEGKIIGLISHVSALTERIGTTIEVTPVSGGRSTITGPGCRRL
ncbi:MAG: AAA family ATPase [Deltaproteobacteria bacterium]|nr:AAA family ATPase [Deltaproteobacteria bacterium]